MPGCHAERPWSGTVGHTVPQFQPPSLSRTGLAQPTAGHHDHSLCAATRVPPSTRPEPVSIAQSLCPTLHSGLLPPDPSTCTPQRVWEGIWTSCQSALALLQLPLSTRSAILINPLPKERLRGGTWAWWIRRPGCD